MVLSLELPLDAATGFERPPKTPQERRRWKRPRATSMMRRVSSPSPDAQCSIHSVQVRVPFLDGKAKTDDHADIAASYLFRCKTSDSVEIGRDKLVQAVPPSLPDRGAAGRAQWPAGLANGTEAADAPLVSRSLRR